MPYKKDCRHCINVGENIAGGTNELFCQKFSEPDEIELDPKQAENCDFYKFNTNYGLYFHEIPKLECIYNQGDKCNIDPILNEEMFCLECPNKGRFARLSFNEC